MGSAPTTGLRQHISATPGLCGGKPCIAGTRIRVFDIASLAQSGYLPDEIIERYPSLTLADVHAALSYYYDNRNEIERQAAEDEKFAEDLHRKLGPGPLEQKLADSTRPKP
ncbi:MAG TPA: DUF433 domain-containing protein [Tepidisphaeraceae bacterium]|nr:DUF433 domain-containing protein [Tepidisphaeraceae bacterium]